MYSTAYPHYRPHFHKKSGVANDDLRADHEYPTNQRRRNLPVGEGRQGPSGEPATGLTKHSGNCLLVDGNRESSYSECDDRRGWEKRGLRSQVPNNSEMAIFCNLGAEPGLRKVGKQGRDLEREIAPSLL
jgi:hypothetical protein